MTASGDSPQSSTRRAQQASRVFAAVLPLIMAIALLPSEFTHYKRWLELGRDESALRAAVGLALLSKTLLVVVVCLAVLALLARFVKPRVVRGLSLGTNLLLFGFLVCDLELQRNTGNTITHYLPFLRDPDTFRWAGEGLDATPGLLRAASSLLAALLPATLLAWLLEHWCARGSARRARALLAGVVGFEVLVLIAAPLLPQRVGPGPLYHLSERMPWSWYARAGFESSEMRSSQEQAQRLYSKAMPAMAKPRSYVGLLAGLQPTSKPDILVVAVESLRHDALTAETMPQVWEWSQQGTRLTAHHATSNASHYGMFALLYGRSPLHYFEVLASDEPVTLPAQLRAWGYTTHHVTCANIQWRQMEHFLGSDAFAVEHMMENSLDACDRDVVSRAAALLEPGERAPRFVLVFLMSTHFGYHFPEGVEPFQPSSPPLNALELAAGRDRQALINRYRNSAHYVDSLIGSLIDRVDSERTLVVVTGDHGESLFDDGTIAHSSLLSEIQTRVPFAMTGPGVKASAVRASPSDHSDLLPTVFARMGIDPAQLDAYEGQDLQTTAGRNFVSLIHAKAVSSAVDRIVLTSLEHRYSIRIDSERGKLLFLGRLGHNGRPARERVSHEDAERAVNWLERYFAVITAR